MYNGTMNTISNLGHGLVGIPVRQGELLLPAARYDKILSAVRADYPDAPDIDGTVLGQDFTKDVTIDKVNPAQSNPPRFFVWRDRYSNRLMNGPVRGRVTVSYRTQNEVYAVLFDSASQQNPKSGSQASFNPDKHMFTTEVGKTEIPGIYWAAFDDGQMIKVDSFGRKIALVEVI